jgi:multicomponent Na+:H+ antiporter subunit B
VTPKVRLYVFLVAGAGLFIFLVWGLSGLPDFGHFTGQYGDILNKIAVPERSNTDVVTAVNFDYRAVDTLGEEFILFAAVVGVASLLRTLHGEGSSDPDDDAPDRLVPETSLAVRVAGLGLVAPTVLVGIYVVLHGHQTPGGGFQGGVILATALLLTYLSADYMTMRRVGPTELIEAAEGAGAVGFVLIGLAGLIFGSVFFQNVLGKGTPGQLDSAGLIPFSNVAVGLAVTGGFAFMLSEFLLQTLVRRGTSGGRKGEGP